MLKRLLLHCRTVSVSLLLKLDMGKLGWSSKLHPASGLTDLNGKPQMPFTRERIEIDLARPQLDSVDFGLVTNVTNDQINEPASSCQSTGLLCSCSLAKTAENQRQQRLQADARNYLPLVFGIVWHAWALEMPQICPMFGLAKSALGIVMVARCRRCTCVNTLLVQPDTRNRKGLNTLLRKLIQLAGIRLHD